MKAFVTGSTGLLGSNLVRQLLAEGYEVVALARTQAKASKILGDTDAQIVLGDMLDIPAFTPHMAGCDVVFHTAAYFKEYTGIDEAGERMLETINVQGTIDILEAAKSHDVRNVIYVSSSGVIGRMPNGGTSDETAPFNTDSVNRYFHSKIRAEEAIAKWLPKNPTMRVILILPGAIVGPGDNGPTGMGGMMIDVLNGNLPANPPGAIRAVDVRDVAQAMIAAIEKGVSGERYCVTGNMIKIPELTKLVADAGGVKAPAITMPMFMILTYAWVMEIVAKVTKSHPQATRTLVKTLAEGTDISSAKAERKLGATFRPLAESIRDEVAWFKANGYV